MRRDESEAATGRPDASKVPPSGPVGDHAGKADKDHLQALQRERQARVVKAVVAIGVAVILIIFIVANSQPVAVDFVFLTRHPRLIWVMFSCALLGGLVGYLIGRPGKQVRLHRRGDEPKPD